MGLLKTLTINGVQYSVTPIVPADSVTLLASAWVGEGHKCSQVVEVPGVTAHTKVDLQPTADQLAEFHHKVLAFVAENNNGVITVYSIGDKPTGNHTIQITKTEVEGTSPIRGNTVGTTMPRPDWDQSDPTKADYILNKPDGIVCEETGSVITANDASNRLLQGLTLYGKTAQDGTPTPENPVELVSAGSVGSIGVTITDEADQNAQTLTASTPNGLPGIPVASGGNYTDENGQSWVCDEIEFTRGVYGRRIGIAVYDGSDDEEWQVLTTRSGSKRFLIQIPTSKPVDSAKVANLLNSQFLPVSADSIYADDTLGCAINQNSSLIAHTPQIQTLDALKAHLENKPMTVAYELATFIETPLSAEELAQYSALHTNKPNISAYNDAGAGMKLAYVADTKLYIDKKFNELAAAIVNNA